MTSGTIKYRAACDHCSATKIKCTQERPSCARCRALGRDCHYSRSLRAGKPPRSSQGLNRRLSNAPVLPRKSSVQEPIPRMPRLAMYHDLQANFGYPVASPIGRHETPWQPNAGSYPTPPAMTPYGQPDMPFYGDLASMDASNLPTPPLDPGWFFDFNNAAAIPPIDILPSSLEHKTPMQQSSPESCDGSKRPSCTSSSTIYNTSDKIGLPQPLTPPVITTPPLSHCGGLCIKIATDTINKLYEMPHVPQEKSPSKHFSVDQVLSSTSQSAQTCLELIICPCQKDFYLPILIAIIASKILAWYQAVALIRDPQTDLAPHASFEPATSQQSPTTPVNGLARELVVDGQLALGAYKLDDQMGWVLKNHIVLAQLQRLGEIVSRYEVRFCCALGLEVGGAKWYADMGKFLRDRLGFTVREIEARLMGG